jgi:acid phosphatase
MCHDTHDCSLAVGDAWLAANVPAMVQAVGPRGIVILTYDEDDRSAGNQILTCFVGTPVRAAYLAPRAVTHYTIVRTICDALGLTSFGYAATETPIDDIWATVGVAQRPWGAVKQLYR